MTRINKTEIIILRCTKAEKVIIDRLANKCGMSLSEYCRKQAKNGKVLAIPKLGKEEIEYLRLLKTYSGNFNRLSNLIRDKNPTLLNEIKQFVEHLTDLQKRLVG